MYNIFSKTLKIELSKVKILSYLYLSIPFFCFLATWVNWKISIFLLCLSILLLFIMYRETVEGGGGVCRYFNLHFFVFNNSINFMAVSFWNRKCFSAKWRFWREKSFLYGSDKIFLACYLS